MSTVAIEDYVSVPEAAEIIGCTPGRVHQLLSEGKLSGQRVNGRAWLIKRREVDKIAKNPSSVGRPRQRPA